jgi:peptide/nickel transport system permease protein
MSGFIARRAVLAVVVAVAVSLIAFLTVRLSGDIAISIAGESATFEDVERIRQAYGLDRPLTFQYLDWLYSAVRGDFGTSLMYRSPVFDLVFEKMPVTIWLAFGSLCFALALSIPLGVLAAVYSNTLLDRAALLLAVSGQALPNFFFALLLIMLFSIELRVLPASGSDEWKNFIMPVVALGFYVSPAFMRLVRAGMIEVLSADYIRTARAKGLSSTSIVFKHALRNAAVPVVALAAVQLGHLLGGSVVIETIFALDGLGFLAYQGVINKDFPIIQIIVLLLAVTYIILTLVGDILNAWLNPRIRIG